MNIEKKLKTAHGVASPQEDVSSSRREFLKTAGASAMVAAAGLMTPGTSEAKQGGLIQAGISEYRKDSKRISYLENLTDADIEKLNSPEQYGKYKLMWDKQLNSDVALERGLMTTVGVAAGAGTGMYTGLMKDVSDKRFIRRAILGAALGGVAGGAISKVAFKVPENATPSGNLTEADPIESVLAPFILKKIPITHEIIKEEIAKLHAKNDVLKQRWPGRIPPKD